MGNQRIMQEDKEIINNNRSNYNNRRSQVKMMMILKVYSMLSMGIAMG